MTNSSLSRQTYTSLIKKKLKEVFEHPIYNLFIKLQECTRCYFWWCNVPTRNSGMKRPVTNSSWLTPSPSWGHKYWRVQHYRTVRWVLQTDSLLAQVSINPTLIRWREGKATWRLGAYTGIIINHHPRLYTSHCQVHEREWAVVRIAQRRLGTLRTPLLAVLVVTSKFNLNLALLMVGKPFA